MQVREYEERCETFEKKLLERIGSFLCPICGDNSYAFGAEIERVGLHQVLTVTNQFKLTCDRCGHKMDFDGAILGIKKGT